MSEELTSLNGLLDAITEKRFASPTVFIQAVRAVCELHGINLPILEIEGEDGPTAQDGKFVLARVSNPLNPDMYAAPDEGEYIFNVEGTEFYLYIVVDHDDDDAYDCYAQVVSEDELSDVMDAELDDFPELVGDKNGETEYEKHVRHAENDVSSSQN